MREISYPTDAFTAILKPVSASCNLRCKYCFYDGQQGEISLMSDETLETVIARCLEATSKSVRFIWHGGEPLLAGISFYERVLKLEEKYCRPNQQVQNSIQTNATLLNEKWLRFLDANGFRIGISLDGPEKLHDFARIDTGGKGTFAKVIRAVNLMQSLGVNFGVIAVINSYSIRCPEQIYCFFSSQELSFSPNICMDAGELTANPLDYARFMIRIFDLWMDEDNPRMRIRPLINATQAVLGLSPRYYDVSIVPKLCRFQGNCHKYLTVDFNGDVYPCDKFTETRFKLGNLLEASLQEISAFREYQQFFGQREEVVQLCDGCEWFQVCQGGCMREWDITGERVNPHNAYCEGRKILFTHIQKRLQKIGAL